MPSGVEKFKLDGEKETAAGAIPVPLRVTVCGLPLALSVMETAPLALPLLCGVKVTLMTQLALGANALPQLLF